MTSPCPSAKLLRAGAVAKFLPFHTVLQHCHERGFAERVHHLGAAEHLAGLRCSLK